MSYSIQIPKTIRLKLKKYRALSSPPPLSARAVYVRTRPAAAMSVAKAEMPDASEKRLLALVLTNAAASCGILRIEFDDVMTLTAEAYKLGAQQPAPPAGRLLFG